MKRGDIQIKRIFSLVKIVCVCENDANFEISVSLNKKKGGVFMLVGQNGRITSYPGVDGEKCCVSCEYWSGCRSVTGFGGLYGAQSRDRSSAYCMKQHENMFSQQQCSSYVRWRELD